MQLTSTINAICQLHLCLMWLLSTKKKKSWVALWFSRPQRRAKVNKSKSQSKRLTYHCWRSQYLQLKWKTSSRMVTCSTPWESNLNRKTRSKKWLVKISKNVVHQNLTCHSRSILVTVRTPGCEVVDWLTFPQDSRKINLESRTVRMW